MLNLNFSHVAWSIIIDVFKMQGMLRDVIQVERRTAQSVLSLCTCAAGAQSSPNFRPDPGHCDSDELSVVGGGAVCADGAGFSLLCSATRPPLPLASSCLFGSFAFSSLAASCPNVNAWLVPAAVRRTDQRAGPRAGTGSGEGDQGSGRRRADHADRHP